MKKQGQALDVLALLVAAFAILALCSMSSPLYPLNIWGDANCLLTVGRAMRAGAVLYRDIYEQKGPTLYLSHMLAAMVSDRSFLGVYFMEVACAFIFLLAAWRFLKRRLTVTAVPAAAVSLCVIAISQTFVRGDSAEEVCLPLMMVALERFDAGHQKAGGPLPASHLFVIGLMAGLVATVKFTLLGVFLGLCLVEGLMALRVGGIRRMLQSAAVFLSGMLLPILAWAAYFAAQGGLSAFVTAYVYNNIFLYAGEGRYALADWIAFLKGSGWWAVPALAGVIAFALNRGEAPGMRLAVGASFVIQLAAVVLPGRVWQYSLMALAPYTIIGAVELGRLLERCPLFREGGPGGVRWVRRYGPTLAAGALCLLLSWTVSPNAFLRGTALSDTVQGRLTERIPEGSSFLQYAFLDDGLYLTTGALPQDEYFVLLNVDLQDMKDSLDRYVEEGRYDYVLVTYRPLQERFTNYELIALDVGYLDNNKPNKEYYLYRRKGL